MSNDGNERPERAAAAKAAATNGKHVAIGAGVGMIFGAAFGAVAVGMVLGAAAGLLGRLVSGRP